MASPSVPSTSAPGEGLGNDLLLPTLVFSLVAPVRFGLDPPAHHWELNPFPPWGEECKKHPEAGSVTPKPI